MGPSRTRPIDPIVVGAQIVTALQTIVSREVDPTEQAVVTVGAFLAGDASNVIPDTATMRGTLRSFNPEVREQIATRVGEIATGVAAAMRADVTYTYDPGYPRPSMTRNDCDGHGGRPRDCGRGECLRVAVAHGS